MKQNLLIINQKSLEKELKKGQPIKIYNLEESRYLKPREIIARIEHLDQEKKV